jgi:hypothetical protein
MPKPYLIIILAGLIILVILLFWPKDVASNYGLANCLTGKGVIMYGSDLCEECKNQKKLLGADFKKINYINCDFKTSECNKKGISVYPVWSLGNKILVGTQMPKDLAAFAGCAI